MGSGHTLHFKVEEGLARLFKSELNLLRETERMKMNLFNKYEWTVEAVFDSIDDQANKFITFSQYFKK